jgi:F-type H+-transporting ATPase subunit delta
MTHDPINVGYARALFEMAQAEGVVGRVEEELFRLRELLKGNPELLQFLKNANVKREGRRQTLADLFQGRVNPLVLNVLLTLSDQDRGGRVLAVIEEFDTVASASRQKVNGEVITARPLDAEIEGRLVTELNRVTGKNVQLFQKVDPSILGGVVIKIGEQVIDGSLRRKLEKMRENLACR